MDTKRKEIRDFLTTHITGTLATISRDGGPRARTVYFASDDNLNVYFLTSVMTRKAEDLEHDSRAAFVVSDSHTPQTLQVEGVVSNVTDAAVSEPVVQELFHRLNSNTEYFAPLARLDPASVRFYKLSPTFVRWGDFTSGHQTKEVLFTILP